MNESLKEKINESLSSVLPIVVIVLVLTTIFIPTETGTVLLFLVGAILLIVGLGLFNLGTDISMTPISGEIGKELSRMRKVSLVAFVALIIGVIITIAEPSLQVLAKQVPSIPDMTLILTVSIGVGIFLAIAFLRTIYKWDLALMLRVFYLIVFVAAFFVPEEFVAIAFDSGGVTTGPVTVPFIMALGVGMTTLRSDKGSREESFGMVGLSSIGPIISVMLLGVFYGSENASYSTYSIPDIVTTNDIMKLFLVELPNYFYEVVLAIAPLFAMFVIFQLITKRFKKRQIKQVLVGYLYTFFGLVIFLVGANVGFIPVGYFLGMQLGASSTPWILLPLGALIGYYAVKAEPALHVLNKQVEEISEGTIPASAMGLGLSIGVALALVLAMIRILTGIPLLYILIPGYLISLILPSFVPKIYTGIAFDSGGVVSGPITSTFILPLVMGACEGFGGNVLLEAFGVVALVAMTPLIIIQVMGLIPVLQAKISKRKSIVVETSDVEDDIIDFEEEE